MNIHLSIIAAAAGLLSGTALRSGSPGFAIAFAAVAVASGLLVRKRPQTCARCECATSDGLDNLCEGCRKP